MTQTKTWGFSHVEETRRYVVTFLSVWGQPTKKNPGVHPSLRPIRPHIILYLIAFLLISTSWTLHLDSLSSSRTSFCVSLRPSLWVTIFWVFVCLNFFHPHSGNIFVMGLDSKWAVSSSTSIVFPLFSFKWRCQSHFCPFGGDWSFLTLSLSLCLFPSMSPSLSSLFSTSKFIFVDCAGGGCTGLLEAVAQYLPLAAETYQHWFFTYCICLNIPHLPFWDSKYIHFVPFTQNFYSSYYP